MKQSMRDEPRSEISLKKWRRWLVRLIVASLAGVTLVMAKPGLIKDETKRAQVERLRDQVLQANTQAQEKALAVLGESTATTKEVMKRVRTVTQEVTHQDPQEIITQTVDQITQEVKDLPQEQVQKIKVGICREILEQE